MLMCLLFNAHNMLCRIYDVGLPIVSLVTSCPFQSCADVIKQDGVQFFITEKYDLFTNFYLVKC